MYKLQQVNVIGGSTKIRLKEAIDVYSQPRSSARKGSLRAFASFDYFQSKKSMSFGEKSYENVLWQDLGYIEADAAPAGGSSLRLRVVVVVACCG